MTTIDRGTLRALALHFDRESIAVRLQVAQWIAEVGGDEYARGVADALLERLLPVRSNTTESLRWN